MLARAIAQRGHHVAIIATRRAESADRGGEGEEQRAKSGDKSQSPVISDQFPIVTVQRNTEFYKVSWELVRWLNANIKNFDVVHIHALFSFSSAVAAFIAHRAGVAYIIRPLGVLNQWGLKNRRALLKRLSVALLEKRILTRASAIHYTSEAERAEAGEIGQWTRALPSFVCPLPVETPAAKSGEQRAEGKEVFLEKFPEARGKQIVLFLSRMDRKKGIDLLLEAFAKVRTRFQDAILMIAGSGDAQYESSVREKAKQLKMSEFTLWTGFVGGQLKSSVLSAADVFVLPSYSENFGIAAAEAMAAGKACILSDQVGLAEEAQRANAAVVTRCEASDLAEAIKKFLNDPALRTAVGQAAAQFARDRLSLGAVGAQLEAEYRAILVNR
jgi:glycosyltransferase involved in cell wall biosynthesis